MNRHFNYNFTAKAIVGSNRSIQRANIGLEPEYSELVSMLAAQPTFTVTPKVINQKKDKKTYSNLTISRMREYIKTQPDAEEKIIEFEAVQKVAKAKGATYPLTKKWFLKTYPEYTTKDISSAQTEALVTEMQEALKKAEDALADIELDEDDLLEEEPTEETEENVA